MEVQLARSSTDGADERQRPLRKNAHAQCGVGGFIALYWYEIRCPGMTDTRPQTPDFSN